MYINKPSVTKTEVADSVNLLHGTIAAGLNSTNFEYLDKCPDMRHFMTVTKKLLLSDIEIKH